MVEFFSSLGLFGWIVLSLGLVGLLTLPQALREMWRRPWARLNSCPSREKREDDGS